MSAAIVYAEETACGHCGAATPEAIIRSAWAHIIGPPDHAPGCPATPHDDEAAR